MKMFRGVLVFRAVAAAYMTTLQAQAQMHPGVARAQAVFTTVGAGRDVFDLIQMSTNFGHIKPPIKSRIPR
jgi:hypothetical protein